MAVANSMQIRQNDNKVVEYQVGGASVRLTPTMVKAYLTNGDGRVTEQEVAMFINLCKYQKLNPLIKDAYLIKYGDKPATIVTSKDAIMKRAMRNPNYAGHQAGIIVQTADGSLDYRTGAFTLPREKIIGGWARTYVKGYEIPIETAVSFEEYAGRKKNGELNSMWAGKPGVMIRKVALVASMREAFPDDLQGMYASEETGADIDDTMVNVDVPEEAKPQVMPEIGRDTAPWTSTTGTMPAQPAVTVTMNADQDSEPVDDDLPPWMEDPGNDLEGVF